MEASCTVQTLRNSCKFFSESDQKKLARAILKNQLSDPGPLVFFFSQCFLKASSSGMLKPEIVWVCPHVYYENAAGK